jgi:hypothetical protein
MTECLGWVVWVEVWESSLHSNYPYDITRRSDLSDTMLRVLFYGYQEGAGIHAGVVMQVSGIFGYP